MVAIPTAHEVHVGHTGSAVAQLLRGELPDRFEHRVARKVLASSTTRSDLCTRLATSPATALGERPTLSVTNVIELI